MPIGGRSRTGKQFVPSYWVGIPKSWADIARTPVAGRSVNEASDASAVFTPAALGMNSAAVVLQLLAVVSRMTWFSIFSVSLFGLPVEHSAPLLLTWRRGEVIWNF